MIAFPETGKISDEFFKTLVYPFCGQQREEVIIPPQFGVDVSLVQLPNGFDMALTSDPLTLIPTLGLQESAWLSVHLMANDMATTGKAPMYAQFVLNLPPTLSTEDFDLYWKHMHRFCKDMGTAITGGHTGRFDKQHATVVGGGTMVAVAPSGEMLTSKGAGPGDIILVTKEAALVASSILALSFPKTIQDKCGKEIQQKAASLFYETSAFQAGLAAAALNQTQKQSVTAMHDVTEGGLLGAIYEMALASACGVVVEEELLPTGEPQKEVCRLFNINPHYCVGAGAMIMAVKKERVAEVLKTFNEEGIKSTIVGRFTDKSNGMNLSKNGIDTPLLHPGTDPYWKAFYEAFAKGLK